MKYGDIVCWRGFDGKGSPAHDQPIMYIGTCSHREGKGGSLIDILDVSGNQTWGMDHKNADMWQVCTHLKDLRDA